MRNNRYLLYILLFTVHCSLFTVFIACGRRGDPVAITPYREIGIVKDLKASLRDDGIYLTWGMPEGKGFPKEALKGFVVLRADVPEGVEVEECECPFTSLDFIATDTKLAEILPTKIFKYLDKKAIKGQTYVYKIAVMDKDNRIGKDSNIVLVKEVKPKEDTMIVPPKTPTGLMAVYTQKSIVLTWDEVPGIKFYNIYRSGGNGFVVIGKSVTPAFTDKYIEPSTKYYYRITAFSNTEGFPSEEIEIITESH